MKSEGALGDGSNEVVWKQLGMIAMRRLGVMEELKVSEDEF